MFTFSSNRMQLDKIEKTAILKSNKQKPSGFSSRENFQIVAFKVSNKLH